MEKIKICGIYKITSPSGKIYIGQSKDIESRWKTYKNFKSKIKPQVKLWRSFNKYTVPEHQFDIIEECLEEFLDCRERYWQDFFDVLSQTGLNCKLQECGTQKSVLSKETIDKIKLNYKPATYSTDALNALKIMMTGNTYNTGRKRSQEEKDSIRNTIIEKGINLGDKNGMWGKTGENSPSSKLILDLNTGIFYFGLKEASLINNISRSKLGKMLRGTRFNTSSLIYV